MSDSNQQMGTWASGMDWYLSVLSPKLYFLQGELLYCLILIFPFPHLITLKLIGIAFGLALIAFLLGYDVNQLWRRFRRLRIGRKRQLYSPRESFLRTKIGI